MTKASLRFKVDSRLATLLSQEYASSEKALKELVDNAWDADAENVSVSLPQPMGDAPIVIADDGCGMTEEELRHEPADVGDFKLQKPQIVLHSRDFPSCCLNIRRDQVDSRFDSL